MNQDAAFDGLIPRDDGMTVGLVSRSPGWKGSQHESVHAYLSEKLWAPYREGGSLYQKKPTIGQFHDANFNALMAGGFKSTEAFYLNGIALRQARQYGLSRNDLVSRVPTK